MKTIKLNLVAINIKKISLIAFTVLFLGACSNDDEPEEVNEEEVITTMIVTLKPVGDGATIELKSKDLDGDGPDKPVITVANLKANTVYNGSIELLNETEAPAEDITEEVDEESKDHQFFYTTTGAIKSVAHTDKDSVGNPLGLKFTLTTSDAGVATFKITLRHEPKKPNDGTLEDAGGETDIEQTFTLTVVE